MKLQHIKRHTKSLTFLLKKLIKLFTATNFASHCQTSVDQIVLMPSSLQTEHRVSFPVRQLAQSEIHMYGPQRTMKVKI